MRIERKPFPEKEPSDALFLFLSESESLEEELVPWNERVGGQLRPPLLGADFRGKRGETLLLPTTTDPGPRRLILIGLGPDPSPEAFLEGGGRAAQLTLEKGYRTVALQTSGPRALLEGFLLGLYRFTRYKTEEASGNGPQRFLLPQAFPEAEVRWAETTAEAVRLVRDLGNTPPNELYPAALAQIAAEKAASLELSYRILGPQALTDLGMGGILAVGQGSAHPPHLILVHHHPEGVRRRIALVGKAITFDSGGISLKPPQAMVAMKFDMLGGATVLAVTLAAARLNLPVEVIGVIPAAENLPGGRAQRPSDILRTFRGKTVEVISTDAEGRLILADALAYAESRFQPDEMIDLATLTSAIVVALGHQAAGLFGNDEALIQALLSASEATGERLWRFPLWPEYGEALKSDVADLKNSGGREGGAITAAYFLSRFVDHTPWAHIDIAGTAWTEKPHPHIPKGPTGFGCRLLLEYLSQISAE